jgi:hypothetical protein
MQATPFLYPTDNAQTYQLFPNRTSEHLSCALQRFIHIMDASPAYNMFSSLLDYIHTLDASLAYKIVTGIITLLLVRLLWSVGRGLRLVYLDFVFP